MNQVNLVHLARLIGLFIVTAGFILLGKADFGKTLNMMAQNRAGLNPADTIGAALNPFFLDRLHEEN